MGVLIKSLIDEIEPDVVKPKNPDTGFNGEPAAGGITSVLIERFAPS